MLGKETLVGLTAYRRANKELKEEVKRLSSIAEFRGELYDSEVHPGIGARLASCGFRDGELAYALGISERTLAGWLAEHSEFRESVEQSQSGTVKYLVAQAIKSAVGYGYEEVHKTYDGEGKLVGKKVLMKQSYPNENLLMFLLTNLSDGGFRHTKNIEVKSESKSVTLTGSLGVLGDLEASEIRKLSGRLSQIAERKESSCIGRADAGDLL